MAEELIGTVTHYFSKIGVAGIELSDQLKVGDTILIKGHTTYLQQQVDSIQLEHQAIDQAEAGQEIGVLVSERVRPGDKVYRVT